MFRMNFRCSDSPPLVAQNCMSAYPHDVYCCPYPLSPARCTFSSPSCLRYIIPAVAYLGPTLRSRPAVRPPVVVHSGRRPFHFLHSRPHSLLPHPSPMSISMPHVFIYSFHLPLTRARCTVVLHGLRTTASYFQAKYHATQHTYVMTPIAVRRHVYRLCLLLCTLRRNCPSKGFAHINLDCNTYHCYLAAAASVGRVRGQSELAYYLRELVCS